MNTGARRGELLRLTDGMIRLHDTGNERIFSADEDRRTIAKKIRRYGLADRDEIPQEQYDIPGFSVVPMVIGGIVQYVWKKTSPKAEDVYCVPLASGFITGEALVLLALALPAAFK